MRPIPIKLILHFLSSIAFSSIIQQSQNLRDFPFLVCHFKHIDRQQIIRKRKSKKSYFELFKLWLKVTDYWNKDRTVNSACIPTAPSVFYIKIKKFLSEVFRMFLSFYFKNFALCLNPDIYCPESFRILFFLSSLHIH